jgi:hypothetical protein
MYKIWFNTEEEMKDTLKLLFFCGYKWIDDSTDFDYPKESRCIFINNIQEIFLSSSIKNYDSFLKGYDKYKEVSIDISINFNPVPEKIVIDGKYYSKEEIVKTIKPL